VRCQCLFRLGGGKPVADSQVPGHVEDEQDQVRVDDRSDDRREQPGQVRRTPKPSHAPVSAPPSAAANPADFVLADQSRFVHAK